MSVQQIKFSSAAIAIAVVLMAATFSSCGKSEVPPLVRVRGTIMLDGRPLAAKHVSFIPIAGTAGQGAGATVGADGRYRLMAVLPGATRDVAGVQRGSYRVVITEPRFPQPSASIGSMGQSSTAAIGLTHLRSAPATNLPRRYTRFETTPLIIEVGQDKVIDLQLTTTP